MPGQRVLLAHENPDCVRIFGSVLEHAGYEVVVADDADSATSMLGGSAFDLVITDLYLRSTGDECFVRSLRRERMWSHIPAVVLTAWTTSAHRRLALDEGADLFLALPVGPRQLVHAVDELLGGRPSAAQGWSTVPTLVGNLPASPPPA